MTKFMQNRYNQKYSQNMWNQNMWPQRNYGQNKYSPSRTPLMFSNDLNYWCETCDKGFKTPDHLQFHIKLHQKCNIDGCQFVAHPKVITKHIQMQHSTGLFKKIGRLNNPEEIQKWRDERKKKYPTKANIEKKQAEIKEKEKRGERMGLNQGKRNIVNKKGPYKKSKVPASILNNKKNISNRKRTISEQFDKERRAKKICKAIPPMEDTRKLKPFKGIQDLINEDKVEDDEQDVHNDIIEDEDYNINNCDQTDDKSKPNICGALSSLICNYGCSDEEDVEENTKVHIEDKKKKENITDSTGPRICVKPIEKLIDSDKLSTIQSHNKSEDDSGPEESQIVKHNFKEDVNIPNKNKKKLLHKKQTIRKIVNFRKKLPSTLLEKLLHSEIQHERNVILQCVRYVLEKDFFKG